MVCLWYISNNSWFFQTQQFVPCFINTSCNKNISILKAVVLNATVAAVLRVVVVVAVVVAESSSCGGGRSK
jgi:hypothetical protein